MATITNIDGEDTSITVGEGVVNTALGRGEFDGPIMWDNDEPVPHSSNTKYVVKIK